MRVYAYENGGITLHTKIHVRRTGEFEGEEVTGVIDTTLGKLLFNEIIPQDLGYVDRTVRENALKLEIDFHVGKKQLKPILDKCINTHGATKTAEVLDDVKAIGYKYSTRSAISVSISDMKVPDEKKDPALKQLPFDSVRHQYEWYCWQLVRNCNFLHRKSSCTIL